MSEDKILYQIISHDSDYIKGIPDKVRTINGTTNHYRFYEESIFFIVTKEQFESMKYEVK